jgi:hypothetical protein
MSEQNEITKEPEESVEKSVTLTEKTWTEFRNTGLLTLANTFLHIFSWAIVVEQDDEGNERVYPARTIFRGFSEESQMNAYKKVSKYMVDTAPELLKETEL